VESQSSSKSNSGDQIGHHRGGIQVGQRVDGMQRRPDLVGVAIGSVEITVARHPQQIRQVLLAQTERAPPFLHTCVARVAEMAQRIDRRWVGDNIRAEGREDLRPYWAAQIRAIAAPVAL
jgi:hypothetical protein